MKEPELRNETTLTSRKRQVSQHAEMQPPNPEESSNSASSKNSTGHAVTSSKVPVAANSVGELVMVLSPE